MSSKLLIKYMSKNCDFWTKMQNIKSPKIKNAIEGFSNYLPRVVDTTLVEKKYADINFLKERIINIAEHEALAREPIQGNLAMIAFDFLARPKDLNDQKLHQLQVLAWGIELVQTYYNIGDDIEDNAKTRSGKHCWHQLPNVGLMAINDADLIRSFIYEMIKNNIEEPVACTVQNYFNETYFALNIGQLMDISLTRSKDFTQFTMEQYNLLNYFKSAFYTVKLPVLLSLSLCNLHNKDAYMYVDKVCTDLGILLQMQNDIMDYVDYKSTSVKTSSDIQNRKCSWPAVAFLENCNESQRREFESCYGQSEPEKVERIRRLYKDIDIVKIYRRHEHGRYERMMEQIKQLPVDSIPSKEFFLNILNSLRHYTSNISLSE